MAKYRCCGSQEWEAVADLGHAAGVDFDLGRCRNCGRYLMAVAYVGPGSTCIVVRRSTAEAWLSLQGTEELRRRLKKWFERD
ncbi:MAG TPA: hypothetical protein VNE39_23195 [Planctomycetota bacterium]|nr:hypothetical protein [Planctomycetota bacterium]